jgi:hypothetical protein
VKNRSTRGRCQPLRAPSVASRSRIRPRQPQCRHSRTTVAAKAGSNEAARLGTSGPRVSPRQPGQSGASGNRCRYRSSAGGNRSSMVAAPIKNNNVIKVTNILCHLFSSRARLGRPGGNCLYAEPRQAFRPDTRPSRRPTRASHRYFPYWLHKPCRDHGLRHSHPAPSPRVPPLSPHQTRAKATESRRSSRAWGVSAVAGAVRLVHLGMPALHSRPKKLRWRSRRGRIFPRTKSSSG